LAAFIVMDNQGVTANIMSLAASQRHRAMVDAAVVMIENMHKHLERAGDHPDYWKSPPKVHLSRPALFFSTAL